MSNRPEEKSERRFKGKGAVSSRKGKFGAEEKRKASGVVSGRRNPRT